MSRSSSLATDRSRRQVRPASSPVSPSPGTVGPCSSTSTTLAPRSPTPAPGVGSRSGIHAAARTVALCPSGTVTRMDAALRRRTAPLQVRHGTPRHAALHLTMRGRRTRGNRAGRSTVDCPRLDCSFRTRPRRAARHLSVAPRVPGRLPDGLSGDGCPDVAAPHSVDLLVVNGGSELGRARVAGTGAHASPVGRRQASGTEELCAAAGAALSRRSPSPSRRRACTGHPPGRAGPGRTGPPASGRGPAGTRR